MVEVLTQFYYQYRKELFSFALNILKKPEYAEDAVHNAFVRLYQLKKTPKNLKPYIFRSVRNAAFDLKKSANFCLAELPENVELYLQKEQAKDPVIYDLVEDILEVLKTLRSEEQEVILLHLKANLTFQEIALVLEHPLGTVTSWYRRGLEHLRKEIKD